MCFMKTPKMPNLLAPTASTDNAQALQQADIEARLRRARSGAAADVLTGPAGIPSGGLRRATTTQLGGVAQ